MFHRQYRVYAHLLLAADVLAGFVSLLAAYFLRHYLFRFAPLEFHEYLNPVLLPFSDYFFYFSAFLPLWVALLAATQRYSRVLFLPLRRQALRAVQFVLAAGFLSGFLVYSFKLTVSRPVFFSFLGLVLLLLVLNRLALYGVLRSRNIHEHNRIRILIVGDDARARRVGRLLDDFKKWGYQRVGYVVREKERSASPSFKAVCSLDELPGLLESGKLVVDEVIFAGTRGGDLESLHEVIRLCEELGIRNRLAADFFPVTTSRISLEFLDNLPLITFSTVPEHHFSLVAKRVLDFAVASCALLVFSPLMVLIAGLIKFTSRGPVFYRQIRHGLYGRRFELVKYRTMVEGAEDRLWEIKHLNEMDGPVFKMRNDPRVTPLGRFLRRYSLDELPQFWNVIKGEMSVVGPRAPLPEEVLHYSKRERRRLSVKPGITCLWQVSGRNDIDFHRWMALDLEYIDNWSLWLDLRIMLKTIPAVFTGRGAR